MPRNRGSYRRQNRHRTQIPGNLETGYREFCLTLPDNEEYLAILLGAIVRLSRQTIYNRDEQHSAKIVASVFDVVAQKIARQGFVPCGEGESAVVVSACAVFEEKEEEDEMARFYTEEVNGVTVLVEDCGCANPRKFALTPFDETGGGTTNPANDSGGFATDALPVSISNEECYATEAAEIISERIKELGADLIDAIKFGLSLTADPSDAYDAYALLTRIFNRPQQYEQLTQVTKQELDAAVENTIKPAVKDAWAVTGEVERRDLIKITNSVPILDGLVPTQFLYDGWSLFVNVRRLNQELSVAATACETGQALPSQVIFPIGGFVYTIVEAAPLAWPGGGLITPAESRVCVGAFCRGEMTQTSGNPGNAGTVTLRDNSSQWTAFTRWNGGDNVGQVEFSACHWDQDNNVETVLQSFPEYTPGSADTRSSTLSSDELNHISTSGGGVGLEVENTWYIIVRESA